MACYYPITITRNGRHQLVPCNRCVACIQRKRGEWSFRLQQEQKNSVLASFLTLTISEEYLTLNPNLSVKDLQLYFKKVRKKAKGLKYYAVAEYGSKRGRPHYHAIVFNAEKGLLHEKWTYHPEFINSETGEITISKDTDPIGTVNTDEVTEASIHYVTGYVCEKYGKMDKKTGKQIDSDQWSIDHLRPFALMSKGLGKVYLKHNEKYHKSLFRPTTTKEGGVKQILPRYYNKLMFPKDEIGIALNLVSNNNEELNTLKQYMLKKYDKQTYREYMDSKKAKQRKLETVLKNKSL